MSTEAVRAVCEHWSEQSYVLENEGSWGIDRFPLCPACARRYEEAIRNLPEFFNGALRVVSMKEEATE